MGIHVIPIDWCASRSDKTITCAHTTWAQTTINQPEKTNKHINIFFQKIKIFLYKEVIQSKRMLNKLTLTQLKEKYKNLYLRKD